MLFNHFSESMGQLSILIRWSPQDSVDLLMSEEERRMYDWCLLRKATHTVEYAWPYEADLSQREEDINSLDVSLRSSCRLSHSSGS